MAINRKINGYPNRSCTYGNRNMHREWPEREWMRTWAINEQCTIINMGSVYDKEHKIWVNLLEQDHLVRPELQNPSTLKYLSKTFIPKTSLQPSSKCAHPLPPLELKILSPLPWKKPLSFCKNFSCSDFLSLKPQKPPFVTSKKPLNLKPSCHSYHLLSCFSISKHVVLNHQHGMISKHVVLNHQHGHPCSLSCPCSWSPSRKGSPLGLRKMEKKKKNSFMGGPKPSEKNHWSLKGST